MLIVAVATNAHLQSTITGEGLKALGFSGLSCPPQVVRVKDIGDKRVRIHGLHIHLQIIILGLFDSTHIEAPQAYRSEINVPGTVGNFLNTDMLASEQSSDVHTVALVVDDAIVVHQFDLNMPRVIEFRQSLRHWPG